MHDRVVNLQASISETVIESVDGGMEAPEQRAGLVRLVCVFDRIVCSTGDVGELPPVIAVDLDHQRSIGHGDLPRRQHPAALQMSGYDLDVVVDCSGKYWVDPLQDTSFTAGHDDEPAIVDEACWKRLEGRIAEPEGGDHVDVWSG